jgi:hypothetical protein
MLPTNLEAMRKIPQVLCLSLVFTATCLFVGGFASAQVSSVATQSKAPCTGCPAVLPIKRVIAAPNPPKVDWTTLPSTYTHEPTGQRVDLYSVPVETVNNERTDLVRSGYRHSRSSLQVGFGSDHYHTTERWGAPVQPYGEWRYPYRPFSVPYGEWGPKLPQVLGGGVGVVPFGSRPFVGPMNQPPFQTGQGMMQPAQPMWGGAAPWGHGQSFGWPGGGGLSVGPGNTLPAGQDEYYHQAPLLRTE